MNYLLIIFVGLVFSVDAFAEVFVVNSSNPLEKLNRIEIRDIYMGSVLFWENEEKIKVAEYSANNPLRQLVSQKYLGIPPNQVYMIWIRVSLSGKASPPKILRTEEEVKQMVIQNPDAIGYLSSGENLPAGIKVIDVK